MKFTLNWLKDHLDTQATLDEITTRLTAIGHELEGVENPADALRPFVVAKILEAGPHPNADKLQLLKVDSGTGTPWQVVCGAPNARTGLVGIFAPPGTYVPGLDFTLKPAKIRDIESFGMMCAEDELGLGEDHGGIIELPADAPVGTSYADYADLDDPVIEVAITPNRQDCMGVRGIARDLAASGLGTLKPLAIAPFERSGPGPDVRTDDPDGCPAFYACTVSGVKNGESPALIQRRLQAIGQKPISALVDITNYVMFDLGRPLHVYDRAKLRGAQVARKAQDGETLTALNGKDYVLDATVTVIADDNGAHDIGGIMGGEATGAADDTHDVLIECAYFTPDSIARSGQKLLLTSDARSRFERGVDPAALDEGIDVATAYVLQMCGGTASDVTRAGMPPVERRSIVYDPALCAGLGGLNVTPERQRAILEALGFAVSDDWTVTVPTWRRDVEGQPDLVEEVIRIIGLDSIPSVPLPRVPGVARPTATAAQKLEGRLRRTAAANGLNEAVNWSFISEKEAASFGGGDWTLANPISEDLKVMRPSLLPGMLSAAKRNLDRGLPTVRLFEIGRRYFRAADGSSDERTTLAILLAGEKSPRDWQAGKATSFSPFDIKAQVTALLESAGFATDRLMLMGEAGAHYHPGQSATLRQGPQKILAAFGALHPATAKAFGLKGAVMAAEIHLDAIPARKGSGQMRDAYAPPALQAVTRDFAFLVDAGTAAGDLVRAVANADKGSIVAARLFDRFGGEGVPQGRLSLAVEVTLQPKDASFTEEQLSAISDRIIKAAAKQGAELRG